MQEGAGEVYNYFPHNQSHHIGQISKHSTVAPGHPYRPFTRTSAQLPWVGSGLRGPTAVATLGQLVRSHVTHMGESLEVHTPVCFRRDMWHTVAHCGTLYHTVAHCGTLWHTIAEGIWSSSNNTSHGVSVMVWIEHILESLNNSVTDTKTMRSKCLTDYASSAAHLYQPISLLSVAHLHQPISLLSAAHLYQPISLLSAAHLYQPISLLFCHTVSPITVFPCPYAQQQVSMTSPQTHGDV